jgi:hypothetical protein
MAGHRACSLTAWTLCWLTPWSGCRKAPPTGTPAASQPARRSAAAKTALRALAVKAPAAAPRGYRAVHVFVALCDNRNQGIAPVSTALGNGQDPKANLYWGAMYGVKTFFRRSSHWRQIPADQVAVSAGDGGAVLDRAVFELAGSQPKVYVLAEAFDGAKMPLAVRRFFEAAAGRLVRAAAWGRGPQRVVIRAGGAADLVCFVGHNGLMDRPLAALPPQAAGPKPTRAVVLACKSSAYFAEPLRRAGCKPLLLTTGLMAPEAYTLDAALRSWARGDDDATTRLRAAEAYAEHQQCSLQAAQRLFVAGGRAAASEQQAGREASNG